MKIICKHIQINNKKLGPLKNVHDNPENKSFHLKKLWYDMINGNGLSLYTFLWNHREWAIFNYNAYDKIYLSNAGICVGIMTTKTTDRSKKCSINSKKNTYLTILLGIYIICTIIENSYLEFKQYYCNIVLYRLVFIIYLSAQVFLLLHSTPALLLSREGPTLTQMFTCQNILPGI